jgi:nucleoside-diphosphate-sugar epimerase
MAKEVFVTGAASFIRSATVSRLIRSGYQALGSVRSDEGVPSLLSVGAEVCRGDLDSLRKRAGAADAVIPTAFNHGFTKFNANCEADRKVIEALVPALAGLSRPYIRVSHGSIETLRFVPKSN